MTLVVGECREPTALYLSFLKSFHIPSIPSIHTTIADVLDSIYSTSQWHNSMVRQGA
jgi:hypothetical protein